MENTIRMHKGILSQETFVIKEECKSIKKMLTKIQGLYCTKEEKEKLKEMTPETINAVIASIDQIESSINDINYYGTMYGEKGV